MKGFGMKRFGIQESGIGLRDEERSSLSRLFVCPVFSVREKGLVGLLLCGRWWMRIM
jgi:hypothetical protein